VLHSLRYLDVAVSAPSPGVPQFMSMGFLDGIPITRYDSERGRVEPQTPWMAAGAEPGFWDAETRIGERNQLVSRGLCGSVSPPGLHIVQGILGCDLLSDGSVRGFRREGYDGRDFISFELGSKSFVAADGAAQVTKRRWEHEGIEVERLTNYLENICVEELQQFIRYGREALERK
ncbi:HMR1 protein, partial [Xiphorhynchus elegans]|nr:HMR1 protein [Xiphorhynchus elegans]